MTRPPAPADMQGPIPPGAPGLFDLNQPPPIFNQPPPGNP